MTVYVLIMYLIFSPNAAPSTINTEEEFVVKSQCEEAAKQFRSTASGTSARAFCVPKTIRN
jgi:hypothetical protein